MEKGKADGLFINTSGIGRPAFKKPVLASRVRPGDVVLINGPIGLHGISVLTARGEFGLRASIRSDVAPLWGLIRTCRALDIPFMRDPTRGGLAQTLNELAQGKRFGVRIEESELPIPEKCGRGLRPARLRPPARGQRGQGGHGRRRAATRKKR